MDLMFDRNPITKPTPAMARKRKDVNDPKIKLAQPDRSGPDPTEKTLYQWAEERNLFEEAQRREAAVKKAAKKDGKAKDGKAKAAGGGDGEERVAEAVLWTATIAMLHFTLDTLVQHQYAQELDWRRITIRTAQAFVVFLGLFTSSTRIRPAQTSSLVCLPDSNTRRAKPSSLSPASFQDAISYT
ncbi:unnamed protein product [Parascedosporium putredinis]|uniref:Deacetylase-like protein n=1 Tax=Parascedosporium putredinis TaxID=1442378 RepID=A0A9P1H991_9PEZI|nr:unnamed protein product [Parascedosporium putredinis]CAI8002880.1 unnamed protein product [Parascedosporium putredinis]